MWTADRPGDQRRAEREEALVEALGPLVEDAGALPGLPEVAAVVLRPAGGGWVAATSGLSDLDATPDADLPTAQDAHAPDDGPRGIELFVRSADHPAWALAPLAAAAWELLDEHVTLDALPALARAGGPGGVPLLVHEPTPALVLPTSYGDVELLQVTPLTEAEAADLEAAHDGAERAARLLALVARLAAAGVLAATTATRA